MEDKVFDYISEYERYMIPAARKMLHSADVYQRFIKKRKNLGNQAVEQMIAKASLATPEILLEVQELENLGEEVLHLMYQLDGYGAESYK